MYQFPLLAVSLYGTCIQFKGECSIFLFFFIMDENDPLSEYNKDHTWSQSYTNGAVYSKIYFKVEICSAH